MITLKTGLKQTLKYQKKNIVKKNYLDLHIHKLLNNVIKYT